MKNRGVLRSRARSKNLVAEYQKKLLARETLLEHHHICKRGYNSLSFYFKEGFMLILLFLVSCTDSSSSISLKYDSEEIKREAAAYVATQRSLFDEASVINGPVCLNEPDSEGKALCNYSVNNQVYSLKCSMGGCVPWTASVSIPDADKFDLSTGNSADSQDWLMWYLLLNNGTSYTSYNSWHSMPYASRAVYYVPVSRTYTTTTTKHTYTTGSYTKSVKTSPSASTKSTRTTTTTSKPSSSKSSSSKSSSSRSSGFRSSSRSR